MKTTNIILSILFLFLGTGSATFAHETEYVVKKERSLLNTSMRLALSNPNYIANDPANRGINYVDQHNAIVSLVYGRENRTDIAGMSWSYKISYDLFDLDNITNIGSGELYIEHLVDGEAIYKSASIHENVSGNIEVRITGITTGGTSAVPDDIRLELELNVERFNFLDPVVSPLLSMSSSTPDAKFQTEAYWPLVEGAEYYELEWVYWDVENTTTFPVDDELFEQAIRIQTNNTHYKIDLIYPAGSVYFRIRPVGRFLQNGVGNNIEKRGAWSAKQTVSTGTGFENSRNWSFSRAYAEDGKHKQAISYFDNGLKGRQSLTNLSSDEITIVAESVYDAENRPTLAIMPVPVKNATSGSNLQFGAGHTNDLITTGGISYSRMNFDRHNVATSRIAALPAEHVASTYYSSLNPFVDHIHNDYVPDAEGYPIAQVKYDNDGRGYVRSQSGVGKFYQLQEGRESKYYYVKPSTTELQSFFGENVGEGKYYRKNYAIDANGQAAVSIVDQAGNTILTALAGAIPANVQDLDGAVKQRTESLMGSNTYSGSNGQETSQITHDLFCDGSNIDYDFVYDLESAVNVINSEHNFCLGCTYDLEIKVVDEFGTIIPCSLLVANTDVTVTGGVLTSSYTSTQDPCSGANYVPGATEISFRATMPTIGSYTVYKTLTATGPNVDDILTTLIANGSILDDSTFITNYVTANFDSTECTGCSNAMRAYLCEQWVLAEYPNLDMSNSDDLAFFQTEVEECMSDTISCEELNELDMLNQIIGGLDCDAMLGEMKLQLSPGGCLYEGGFYSAALTNSWTIPNILDVATGNIITTDATAVAMIEGSVPWQDSWIDDLVVLHPEYCRYLDCINDPIVSNSKHFDYDLANYQTWNEAAVALSVTIASPPATTAAEKRSIIAAMIANDPFISTLTVGSTNPLDDILDVYCTTQCSLAAPQPCTCSCADIICFLETNGPLGASAPASESDHWDLFRGIYAAQKQILFYNNQCTLNIPPSYTPAYPDVSCKEITGEPQIQVNGSTIGLLSGINTMQDLQDAVEDNIYGGTGSNTTSLCNQLCEGRAKDWINSICPNLKHIVDSLIDAGDSQNQIVLHYNDIRTLFIDYCLEGCGDPGINPPYLANPLGHLITEDLTQAPFTSSPTDIPALLSYLQTNHTLCNTGTTPANLLAGIAVNHSTVYQLNISYYNASANLPVINPKCSLMNEIFTVLDDHLFPVVFSRTGEPVPVSRSFAHTNTPTFPTSIGYDLIGVPSMEIYTSLAVGAIVAEARNDVSYFNNDLASVRLNNDHYYDTNGDWVGYNRFIQFVAAKNNFLDPCNSELGIEFVTASSNLPINPLEIVSIGTYDCATNTVMLEVTDPSCAYANNTPALNTTACSGTGTQMIQASVRINVEPCIPSWEMDSTWIPIEDSVTITNPQAACDSAQIAQLTVTAGIEYQTYVNSIVNKILTNVTCVPVQERMIVSYESTQQHHTLYYYDEAGNLVQTLPPAAVFPLDMEDPNNYDLTTGELLPGVHPHHNFDMLTTYSYNTLGQVISQESPDGGLTHFYYDYAQRLRLSQNARQAPIGNDPTTYGTGGDYAYTKFDKQGRMVEVGKLENYVVDIDDLNTFAFPDASQTSEETFTQYDNPMAGGSLAQQNLRSRVSGTYNSEEMALYTYDIHGNVTEIQRQIALFGAVSIKYDYDLITGNVNQVAYNQGAEDQFFHRYTYDADNRLMKAKTSKNGHIWETDARYFYYAHGPLARVEIGEDKVQGLDYYYNLQGWIKGVNNSTKETDLAKDGDHETTYSSVNKNKWFGKDEYAYHLGYHREDYKAIGSSSLGVMEHTATTIFDNDLRPASATGATTTGLFNGNIAFMITHIPELENQNNKATNAMVYQYDALHRIKRGRSYHYNKTTSAWAKDLSTEWNNTDYSYDRNGNIQDLVRYNKGTKIDDLHYKYKELTPPGGNVNQNLVGSKINQLQYVDDDVTAVTVGDFGDQGLNNYNYDEVGNLTEDASQDIDNGGSIQWNLMNKIDKVTYDAATGKTPLEFTYDASGSRLTKTTSVGALRETTVYIRDAGGNILATYQMVNEQRTNIGETPETFPMGAVVYAKTLKETVLYGASRIGVRKFDNNWDSYQEITEDPVDMLETITILAASSLTDYSTRGDKLYECSNHLGNVLVTISDKKIGKTSPPIVGAAFYKAIVKTASDYYPFGWQMPNRKLNTENYSYGFNGQIQDAEWMGGQSVAFEFRTQDARLGRFLSVDPLTALTPHETPYAFAGNSPIQHIDYLGLAKSDSKGGGGSGGGKVKRYGFFKRLGNTLKGKGYLNKANKYAAKKGLDEWQVKEGDGKVTVDESKLTSPESFEGAEDDGSFSYTLTEKETTFSKRKQETSNSGGSSLASIAIIATKSPIPQAKALGALALGMYGIYTIYQLNGVEIGTLDFGDYAYTPPTSGTGDKPIVGTGELPNQDVELSLGFLPYSELRDGDTRLRTGHLIVGIGVAGGGGKMWFHSSGNIGKRAIFKQVMPDEMARYLFDLDIEFVRKTVSVPQGAGALSVATAKLIYTQNNVIPYDPQYNNCATNCADVLKGAGYNPPNMTSKLPSGLFQWFKTQ